MFETFVAQIFHLEGFDMTSVKVLNYSTSVTSLIGEGNYMWWLHNVHRTNNFLLIKTWKTMNMILLFRSNAVDCQHIVWVCVCVRGWGWGVNLLLLIEYIFTSNILSLVKSKPIINLWMIRMVMVMMMVMMIRQMMKIFAGSSQVHRVQWAPRVSHE